MRAVVAGAFAFAVALALGAGPAPAAAPKPGGKCAKAGAQAPAQGLVCVRKGGKLVWAPYQGGHGGGSGNGGSGDASPKLENFQVRVGSYDPATGKAGDLIFSKAGLQPQLGLDSVFLEFGHEVFGAQTKDLPHFTFYAPLGTQVLSPLNGVVVFVEAKPSGLDDTVTIAPFNGSTWAVNLDHIKDRSIQLGDKVTAGEVIGTVGIPEGSVAGWGANEMTVEHFLGRPGDQSNAVFVCPWQGWDPAALSSAQGAITRLMSDWETWYGDATVYAQASQVSPGCDLQSEPAH